MRLFGWSKKHLRCCIILFILGLLPIFPAREAKTIFAYNPHNLGYVVERVVKLSEENQAPGLLGRAPGDYGLCAF